MKGGDTIETAQITSIQTVKADSTKTPAVDKKDFLEKLETFLSKEGEASKEETALAEEALAIVESASSEKEDVDLEEELQALFTPLQFQFLTEKNPTPLNESSTEIVLEAVSTIEPSLEPSISDQEVLASVIEVESTIDDLDLESDMPLNEEKESFKQVVAEMTSKQPVIESESLTQAAELFVKEEPVEELTVQPAVLEETEEVFQPQVFETAEPVQDINVDQPLVENQLEVEPLEVDEILVEEAKVETVTQKDQPIEQVDQMEQSEQPETIENWFRPVPEVTTVDQPVEAAPIQISQQEWTSQVEQIVVKEFQTAEGNKVTTTHIQLTPERLGKMQLDLTIENRELHVQIRVEHLETKEWLESQLSLLTTNLATQDISVSSIQIEVEPTQANPFTFDQGQQPSQEEPSFEQQRQWKGQRFNNESLEEQEVSPNIINSARGLSYWA